MTRPPIDRRNESLVWFRDDDRGGRRFQIVRGSDGDFHLSVVPDWRDMTDEDERERTSPAFGGSIRVRMPMIGGGEHEALYAALSTLWRKVEHTPIYELAARAASGSEPNG